MTPHPPQRRPEAGFTLLELLIVVGTVAVLMSVLGLGVRRAMESFDLRRAASTVVAEIRNAQAGALADHVDYVVEFGTTASGGPPGTITLFRPGVPVTGTPSVTSSGASDTRSVTVVGLRTGVGMVSDTLFLNGTAAVNSGVTFDWVLQADTPQPNSCCTISVRQGGTTLATIGPALSSAALTWTQIRVARAPDWPRSVRMDPGASPLPLCSSYGSPWTLSSSRCLRFRALGYPDQAGELLLCSSSGVGRRIAIAAGTGRVSVDPAGCP